MSDDDRGGCGARSPDYDRCERPRGHAGKHKAVREPGVLAKWDSRAKHTDHVDLEAIQ